MTDFTLDWSSIPLDDTHVTTASGQAMRVEMSTTQGASKDAFRVGVRDDQPVLFAHLDHGPLEITIRLDDAAGSVAFALFAGSRVASGLPNGCNIVARGNDGQKVPVICRPSARHAPDARTSQCVEVTIPGPILSLTLTFDHPGKADAPRLIGIGSLTFDSDAVEDDSGFDILNLIGAEVDFIKFDAGAPQDGIVAFANGQTIAFSEIDRVVPCFTPGTAIATPKGEIAVEKLRRGDRILTRDNGIQTISWVGTKRLDFAELKAAPQLRPIKIKAGAMGDNMPERDMLVSPSHRMLIVSHQAELYFNQSEILVAAQHMLAMDGVEVCEQPYVTYIHIMCENHEIVLSDGAWSESFQPADLTLKGFDTEQREELFALFPQLQTNDGVAAYGAARRTLSRSEAKLLFKG